MDFLIAHPGVSLVALALALIIIGALLRRVVFIVAAVTLIAACSMVFPGPRALMGAVATGEGISGRAECALAGITSWRVLDGTVNPADLPECATEDAPRGAAKGTPK